MSNLTAAAANEKKYIEKLMEKASAALEDQPGPTLNITKKNGTVYYYERLPGKGGKKVYIPQSNMEYIKQLAQKDYYMKILRNLIARKLAIEKLEAIYPEASLESIYENLSPERRSLVEPVILTDSQYISAWLSENYDGKSFDEDDESCFFSDKGERVRSKSEVIIANYLFHAGIPYKYECPLRISSKTIYPDFTVLDVKNRCVYYLEHFGMMDDPEYSQNFVNKLYTYQSGGIFPGKKLIMTFETSKNPLDTRMVKQTVEQYIAL